MRRVTLDTNVYISALNFGGQPKRLLECAVEAGSEVIITNDKDLLRMQEYQGIKIIRVREFLRQESA